MEGIKIIEQSNDVYKYKITLFGTAAVGKTSLLLRYVKNSFSEDLKKTIGSNFLIKDVNVDDKKVRLLLWDIGGQAQFQKLRRIYFKGSNAAFGVYDVTNTDSLMKVPGWVSSINKSVNKEIPMILVGNKIDLERKVSREEGEELAGRLKCTYLETSAKTGENVEKAFQFLARKCLETFQG